MSKNDIFESDLELKLEPTSTQGPLFASEGPSIKGKRLLIIGGSMALFLIIAYFLTKSLARDTHPAHSTNTTAAATVTQSYNSVIVDFPEIVTNLAPTNDKESYIRLVLTLELNNTKDQDAIDKKLNMLKDSVIIFLRELRAADLTSAGGSMMLKTEVTKRINKILYPIEIKDILFKEIFVNQ